jgi:tRNA(fMet)-specific endonuclease VapC
MALVIDSNVFIGMERRGLGLSDLSRIGPDQPAALASVTASELWIGVMRSAPGPRREARSAFVEAICQRLPNLAFELAAARIHAWLWVELAALGTPIGPHDLLIAAAALSNRYAVLTDNVIEFRRIPGLVVLQPT